MIVVVVVAVRVEEEFELVNKSIHPADYLRTMLKRVLLMFLC